VKVDSSDYDRLTNKEEISRFPTEQMKKLLKLFEDSKNSEHSINNVQRQYKA